MLLAEQQSWGSPCARVFFGNEAYRVEGVATVWLAALSAACYVLINCFTLGGLVTHR